MYAYSFVRYCQVLCSRGCTILHSQQWLCLMAVFSLSFPKEYFVMLLGCFDSDEWEWSVLIVLFCIFIKNEFSIFSYKCLVFLVKYWFISRFTFIWDCLIKPLWYMVQVFPGLLFFLLTFFLWCFFFLLITQFIDPFSYCFRILCQNYESFPCYWNSLYHFQLFLYRLIKSGSV